MTPGGVVGPAGRAGGGTGGLLAVHAHPDDETLSTGALLAAWAEAGWPVTVVTCTRGERGEVIPPELAYLTADAAALAAHRERELAAALSALGVTDHVFLDRVAADPDAVSANAADIAAFADQALPAGLEDAGLRYEDSGMTWLGPGRAGPGATTSAAFVRVPVAEAAARLAAVIRDRRPDVVVGYEPGGGYGHPDHVHAHHVMRAGVERAALAGPGGAGHRVPVVLWAAVDAVALRAARGEVPDDGPPDLRPEAPDADLPAAAVPPDAVAVRVSVAPVLARVVRAMAAHATQVQGVRTWGDRAASLGCFALSNRVLQPILTVECYVADPSWDPAPNVWPAHVSSGIA